METESRNVDLIIAAIQKVRSDNNKCWMGLLKIAFKHAPEEAKEIFREIALNDEAINKLSKELSND